MKTGQYNIDLYEHQKLAIEQLTSGKILCAGVGTGKSRTALAYFCIKECGGSYKINGEGEYKPMTNPKPLYIITTAKKRDSLDWEKEAIPFGLYDNIKVDSWNNIQKYENVFNSFFIFDEQHLTGYGKWVKVFLRIAKHNRWILLTATPGDSFIEYLPVFMANGFYRTKTEFIQKHVETVPYVNYFKVKNYKNTARLIQLKEMILVEMEYTKPVEEHHKWIECNYDKEKYELIFKYRWNPYEERPIENISAVFSLMRRVTNSDSSRKEKVREIIARHPKVIIFYSFDYELDILRSIAKELKIEKAELNGHLHQDIPKSSEWLYFVQYASGAEAWNCIETNAMIFYSQSYSWKATEQAIGRISRMNTPFSDLYYYHLTSKAPIDKSIKRCLDKKKNFNEKTSRIRKELDEFNNY